MLLKAKNQGNKATLVGNGTETIVIKNEKIEIFGNEGATVSVFAFGVSEASGVTIEGLKYTANNITLSSDYPLGVSNSFRSSGRGAVAVGSGALLIIKGGFPTVE